MSMLLVIAVFGSACGGSEADDVASSDVAEVASSTTVAPTTDAPTTAAPTTEAPEATEAPDSIDPALSAGLGASFGDEANPLTADEEMCVGDGTVTAIGSQRLSELGVTAENAAFFNPASLPELTDAERELLVAVADSCLDLRTLLAELVGEGDPAATACAYEVFDRGDGREVIRSGMNVDENAGFEEMVAVFEKAGDCFFLETAGVVGDDAEALVVALAESNDDGTTPPEVARCQAEAIVNSIGFERLTDLGLTVSTVDEFTPGESDMTSAERDAYIDSIGGCTALKRFAIDFFLVGIDSGCLEAALTDDDAWRYLRAWIEPVDSPLFETPADIQAKIDSCA